jgi:hypothetical protein
VCACKGKKEKNEIDGSCFVNMLEPYTSKQAKTHSLLTIFFSYMSRLCVRSLGTRLAATHTTVFFAPSPPVAALIQQELDDQLLKPGHYVATHIRSLYVEDKTSDSEEYEQAVICAAQLRAGRVDDPIFVATDSNQVTQKALEFGTQHGMPMTARSTATTTTQHLNRTVETRHDNGTVTHHHPIVVAAKKNNREPLHLDRGRAYLQRRTADVHKHAVSDFYNIFVDLYLLANAACVSYGTGRFGRLASQLSYNISCFHNRRESKRRRTPCQWPLSS